MGKSIKKYRFLFTELVKRDFKKKYKRTALGMLWSALNPLLHLLVLWLVFSTFFGHDIPHYVIYMFSGRLIYGYFTEATSTGMTALTANAGVFTKVNIPKYLFVFSGNVSALIGFVITFLIYLVFVVCDGIAITWRFVLLLYPMLCLVAFNVGCGLVLSALYVFFKDVQYLWSVFTMLLMYLSAIFYSIDAFSETVQKLFLCNPLYLYIRYFRKIVIEATVPSVWFHLLAAFYALVMLGVGLMIYKKYNTRFLYYV